MKRFHRNRHRLWVFVAGSLITLAISAGNLIAQQSPITIDDNNEFGGRTYEFRDYDSAKVREYYDDDESLIRAERVFDSEFPVDNGLLKTVTFYAFDKKVKEEKFFNRRVSQSTWIEKTIEHYDQYSGQQTKTENHFINAFPGYNIIYREDGRKTRIEWYYPDNVNGIVKHFVYFNDKELATKVESFYSEKTKLEEGYFRRVYYNGYTPNNYYRKVREEVYYTDEYATNHHGISKVIKLFHYHPGKLFDTEIHIFNKQDKKLFVDENVLAEYAEQL